MTTNINKFNLTTRADAGGLSIASKDIRKVTVAILTYNNNEQLQKCLQSVTQSQFTQGFEIIVVDNSVEPRAQTVYESFKTNYQSISWQYLHSPQNNLGFARKLAVEKATSAIVAFLDSDCVVDHNWLAKMYDHLIRLNTADAKVVAVGSGNDQPKLQNNFYEAIKIMKLIFIGHINSAQIAIFNNCQQVDHLSTCNVMYIREALLNAGNFSPKFSRFGEDIDLSRKLNAKGYTLYYVNDCVVVHYDKTNIKAWAKRIFSFGRAQIKLIFMGHVFHLINRRVVLPMFLLTLFAVDGLLVGYWPIKGTLTLFYFLICLVSTLYACRKARRYDLFFKVFLLLMTTHVFYILGELYEFVRQLVLFAFTTVARLRLLTVQQRVSDGIS